MTDPTTQPTRIVLAEDSVLLRDGIVRLLTSAGFEVPAACPDAETFLAAVDEHEPDLVVVDVRMPPTFTSEGIVAALAVRDKHPETAVMVLSQYVEEQYATELVASRSTGVGYLLKDRVADTSDFIAALRDRLMLAVPAGDNVVRILPPLNVTSDEVREGLERIEAAAQALSATRKESAA